MPDRSAAAAKAAETRKANAIKRARLERCIAANQDEIDRFMLALKAGAVVIMQTAFGAYQIDSIDYRFDAHGHPAEQARTTYNSRLLCYGNGGDWEEMLKQAGVVPNAANLPGGEFYHS